MQQVRSFFSQEAFSLMEVLIAIFIFSVGILAVSALQISSMRTNAQARMLTESSSLASESIERLVALPFDDANLADVNKDGAAGLDKIGGAADFTVVRDGYTVSWNVAEDVLIDGTKTIRVIVQYNERGVQRQVVFERIRHKESK